MHKYSIIIDQGNSTTKIAIRLNGQITQTYTMLDPSSTEIRGIISRLSEQPTAAIYASVAERRAVIIETLKDCTNGRVYVLGAEDLPLPIDLTYDKKTIGVDRIAAAVGAYYIIPQKAELLVIDIGTCITIDRVSTDGIFLGGNISPGVRLRLQALHQFTERLPLVKISDHTPRYGQNTNEAIQAGVMRGIIHELDGYIAENHDQKPSVVTILTGGASLHFGRQLKNVTFARRDLVLIGLGKILDYQDERCIAP